jgi:hypothetical protein
MSVKNGVPKSSWIVNNVPGCVSSNAKKLGLQHLYFIIVCVVSGPPDQTCVLPDGADELLVEQHAIPDGQTTPPVEERG